MTASRGFLVIGADSLVGRGLVNALRRRGIPLIASTRRTGSLNAERVFLDYENSASFRVPSGFDYVFVVAAATNYDLCERDPLAQRINVELIPRLVASLLAQEAFVTFISTNAVFGGEHPWPGEDDPHAPGIAYARQKSEGEAAIRATAAHQRAMDRLNIVRLTKTLDRTTPPIPDWLAAWRRAEAVRPFADLIFAPMSVRFVGEALASIGEKRVAGNLHLSGANNVSYVEFAQAVAARLGIDRRLIVPSTATEQGVHVVFKPRYSGLDMQRTTAVCGILPQPLPGVVDDLFSDA
jgi:dTDP-4-dehydrorhamnose reductase